MKKNRRTFLSAIMIGALTLLTARGFSQNIPANPKSPEAIRPFHVHVPQAELADLRRRILATRWPDKETVNDQSQGAQLAKLQALMHYWATSYD